jgi:hypothetical protein
MKDQQPRCDECNHFVSYSVVEQGGSVDFVPDTHFTSERFEWRCAKCTEKSGGRIDDGLHRL